MGVLTTSRSAESGRGTYAALVLGAVHIFCVSAAAVHIFTSHFHHAAAKKVGWRGKDKTMSEMVKGLKGYN